MQAEMGDVGYLRIETAEDRDAVVGILFRNGYTVSPMRRKRSGRSYEYYVKYELRNREMEEEE